MWTWARVRPRRLTGRCPPGHVSTAVATPVPGLAQIEPTPHASSSVWLAACFGIVVCVGVADYLTGREVALILFYLAPVGFATWYVGLKGGIALAMLSAAVSTGADTLHEVQLPSEGGPLPAAIVAWNCAIQL